MKEEKAIAWFSCGVTSAVACKLAINQLGVENIDLYYIAIKSAHEDNERFIKDCEQWFGKEIKTIQSAKYIDQFDVIESTGYVNGPYGARCTLELKKKVRIDLQNKLNFPIQVFGFEYSKKEVNRAIRFLEQYPEAKPRFPLIESSITKEMCADILLMNGIKLPVMYKLGFHNNNCIGCVKGGKGYWNHIRKHFPETFDRMALLEREVGNSCIKDVFLDELKPTQGTHKKPIVPDCGSICEIKFADIIHKDTDLIYNNPNKITQLYLTI